MHMLLITSGAYITEDFISEIGRLPPAFLPVGNKRLFEHQLNSITGCEDDIYLSVPADYALTGADQNLLDEHGVRIIRVPPGLNLGAAIIFCWNATGVQHDGLKLLHGDSLFTGLDYATLDCVSVDANEGFYRRATCHPDATRRPRFTTEWVGDGADVISGYFAFSNPPLLLKGIIENANDFIAGINFYDENIGLTPVRANKWYDFGHINSFFRSRTSMTTERAFNAMEATPRYIMKSSKDSRKISAEANWYESLPADLQYFVPRLYAHSAGKESASYKLDYLYLLPLNDLFVYGNLSGSAWKGIFGACKTVLDEMQQALPEGAAVQPQMNDIYLAKTVSRLQDFYADPEQGPKSGFDHDQLHAIALDAARFIPEVTANNLSVVHGDFCFSNILYDNRLQAVKLIDPRGIDASGNFTVIGDARYDLAKLYHSVIGLFDLLIANRFSLDHDGELRFETSADQQQAQEIFRRMFFAGNEAKEREILAINVLLFLSMLPLHHDRPATQKAFIANAFRLHAGLGGANL